MLKLKHFLLPTFIIKKTGWKLLATSLATAAIWLSPINVLATTPTPELPAKKALFALQFKDELSLYSTFSMFVMPGEQVLLEPVLEPLNNLVDKPLLSASITAGTIERAPQLLKNKPANGWIWTAPKTKGLYPITIFNPVSGTAMTINTFVMVPATKVKNGMLNGFRVGRYPRKLRNGNQAYKPPRGFIEVTEENRNTLLSPHFRLGEFVTKQNGGWPKYVALRERLLLKLELIIDELQSAGYPASSLHVMSGFRTPAYNKRIGQGEYSRHQWGDAADIFVDESPKNGVMDDLNEDGQVSVKDAREIYDLVNELNSNDWYRPFIGGMGLYKSKPGVRGPFVHVDVRGQRARWGSE